MEPGLGTGVSEVGGLACWLACSELGFSFRRKMPCFGIGSKGLPLLSREENRFV